MYTWIVSITAYYRSWKVGKRFLQIQKYFIRMCLLQGLLLLALIVYQPLAGTLIFLLPMVTGLFLTVYTTYHHHSGLESTDPLESSYNIVERWYNLLTGNLGYHTAHHMKG
jgi:fatty acid desaturase